MGGIRPFLHWINTFFMFAKTNGGEPVDKSSPPLTPTLGRTVQKVEKIKEMCMDLVQTETQTKKKKNVGISVLISFK